MKRFVFVTLAVLINYIGYGGEFKRDVEEFNMVSIQGNFKAKLRVGDAYSVSVINNEEDLDDQKIVTEVKNKVLKVRIKGDLYSEKEVEVIITCKSIDEIEARAGCKLEAIDELKGDDLVLKVDAGGKIKAKINVNKFGAEISAGGSIHVSGIAEQSKLQVSAGGTIGAISLKSKITEAKVTAGGEIICLAGEELKVNITSGGNVSYLGVPDAFEQKVTLGGTITKLKSQDAIKYE